MAPAFEIGWDTVLGTGSEGGVAEYTVGDLFLDYLPVSGENIVLGMAELVKFLQGNDSRGTWPFDTSLLSTNVSDFITSPEETSADILPAWRHEYEKDE